MKKRFKKKICWKLSIELSFGDNSISFHETLSVDWHDSLFVCSITIRDWQCFTAETMIFQLLLLGPLITGFTYNLFQNALFAGSVFLTVCLTLGGYAILLPHMPIFFYYISYSSYMRFGLELLVMVTYGLGRPSLPCPDTELYCQVKQPKLVLDRMGIDEGNFVFNIAFLCSYTLAMIAMAFFCIRKSIKEGWHLLTYPYWERRNT